MDDVHDSACVCCGARPICFYRIEKLRSNTFHKVQVLFPSGTSWAGLGGVSEVVVGSLVS